jgi:putative hemolysin
MRPPLSGAPVCWPVAVFRPTPTQCEALSAPDPDPLPAPRIAMAAAVAAPLPLPLDAPPDLTGMVASPLHLAIAVAGIAGATLGTLGMAALLSYSPARMRQLLEEDGYPDPALSTAALDQRDEEYLVTAAALGGAGWGLGLWATAEAFAGSYMVWAVAAFLVVTLWLAVSLIGAAQERPERILLRVLRPLRVLWLALRWPLVLPIAATSRLVLRASGAQAAEPTDTAEVQKQVLAAVTDTVTEGSLPHAERTWIGNIIGLKDLQVSTLMTPRPDIVAFPESMSLREGVQKALEHGFSRYPVYRDRIDEIIGIFYVKDALRLMQDDVGQCSGTPLRSMLREVLFAPETTGAAQLLRRFQSGNQHMAIVIDEYGTTVGLVTVEDVIEAIVGDIGDEYDPPPSAPDDTEQIRVVETGRVLEIPARTAVAEVNQLLGSELPEEGDWETVAGLVIARLNHIPVVDETVAIDGVEFRVLQADERRIQRLRATLLAPQPAEGSG